MAQAWGDAGLSNIATAEKLMAAWNARDFECIFPLLAEDIELMPVTVSVIEGGAFRGIEGARRLFANSDAVWSTFEIKPAEFCEGGDVVVIYGTVRAVARGSGLGLDSPAAYLIEFRNGLVVYWQSFFDHDEAKAAARERGAAIQGGSK